MIKSIFLNQRSKTSPKNKEHGTYQDAENIGILYNAEEFHNRLISDLSEVLKNENKSVAKLGFVEKPIDPEPTDHTIFTKKDISSTGTIKKESISFFISQPFDFLISLDTSEDINYKYILAASKAVCKIGIETESYQNLLLLSIKSSEQKKNSIDDLIKYLRKI